MSEEIVIEPSVENVEIIKKPLSEARLEQLKKAREAAQKKKKEIKEITTKSKSLKLEEAKLKAYQFDELMKKKEEIMNPPKEEIKEEIKEEVKEVKQPKKKRIIKKIIYEDDSEEEVEVMEVEKYKPIPQQQQQPQMNHETYTHLMYQNAYEKLQNKVNEERTKLLVQSLMPNHLFR